MNGWTYVIVHPDELVQRGIWDPLFILSNFIACYFYIHFSESLVPQRMRLDGKNCEMRMKLSLQLR